MLPQGWKAVPRTASFGVVTRGASATVTFKVTPPSYAPNTNQVVHATANLGGSDTREAGVTVTVGAADRPNRIVDKEIAGAGARQVAGTGPLRSWA